jgi:lysozyme
MITLRRGSHVEEVEILQRLLRRLGYKLSVDAHFGPTTERVVINFQSRSRVLPDGIVGVRTWAVLFENVFETTNVLQGIDISHHNTDAAPINWKAVSNDFYFCFVKASQGRNYKDPRFLEHMAALKNIKMLRGAYHFFRMLNTDVDAEIENFLNTGIDFREKGILPPVLDVEPLPNEFQNQNIFSQHRFAIAQRMKKWLIAVEKETGKTPIIYTTRLIWDDFLGSPTGFEHYPLWVADYALNAEQPRLPRNWSAPSFWQYTENGTIAGQNGFDINRCYLSYAQLLRMSGY